MSQTNRTTMVLSIVSAMCWFVDSTSDRGILVLFCSVFVAELILFRARLLGEVAVYPHQRLELSLLWDVSAKILFCVTEANYEGFFWVTGSTVSFPQEILVSTYSRLPCDC